MRNMFVANRMTKNPITVEPTTSVNDAAKLMKQRKIRRLPVVEKGRLVGIISDRDVMRVAPSPATTLSKFEIMSLLDKMTVAEIMAKEVVSLPDTATIEEAALVMYNERLSGLPVVSSMGAVVGIITETDVFKTFVDVMGLADGKTRLTLDVETTLLRDREINRRGLFWIKFLSLRQPAHFTPPFTISRSSGVRP